MYSYTFSYLLSKTFSVTRVCMIIQAFISLKWQLFNRFKLKWFKLKGNNHRGSKPFSLHGYYWWWTYKGISFRSKLNCQDIGPSFSIQANLINFQFIIFKLRLGIKFPTQGWPLKVYGYSSGHVWICYSKCIIPTDESDLLNKKR